MSVGACGCLLLVLSGKAQGNCAEKEQVTAICWMFFVFFLKEMMHFSWILEVFSLHPEGREESVSRGVKALGGVGGNRGWK